MADCSLIWQAITTSVILGVYPVYGRNTNQGVYLDALMVLHIQMSPAILISLLLTPLPELPGCISVAIDIPLMYQAHSIEFGE